MQLYDNGYFVNRRGEQVQVFEKKVSFFYDKNGLSYREDGSCEEFGTNLFDLTKEIQND